MGAKNSQGENNITYLKLKAKTSDTDPTPYFGVNTKTGNGYEITAQFDAVDGNLIEIKHESYVYEGETKYKCKMKLKDNDGTLTVLESNFNNLLYNILNAFAGCVPGFIEIKVYLGKVRDNGKQYSSAVISNNGEKAKWKYELSELPRPEKVPIGNTGKTYLDDSNVIKFWQGEIEKINTGLKKEQPKPNTQQAHPPLTEDVFSAPDSATDDLPF